MAELVKKIKKISEISILQSAHKQGSPSFHCHAPVSQHIAMHSNSIDCPKVFPLSAPVLYWLSHLTCISSLKAKNMDFYTAKKYPDTTNTFSQFLDELLSTDLRPIYCSLTTETASVTEDRWGLTALWMADVFDLCKSHGKGSNTETKHTPTPGKNSQKIEKNGHKPV